MLKPMKDAPRDGVAIAAVRNSDHYNLKHRVLRVKWRKLGWWTSTTSLGYLLQDEDLKGWFEDSVGVNEVGLREYKEMVG
jgi:hypothetical protein